MRLTRLVFGEAVRLLCVERNEVHEVAAEFAPLIVDSIVALAQCHGTLVEVDAYVVTTGAPCLEDDELYVGNIWNIAIIYL